MYKEELMRCRVCGLLQSEPPWGWDGKTPTYNFCPCCGVEFGYGDATPSACQHWLDKWLSNGAKWDAPKAKPENWDIERQLSRLDSILEKLSARELQTIGECLNAAAFTDNFFPDWEFTTLFGISRERVKVVASSWPNVDICDEDVRVSIIGALGHLLGYPHGQEGVVWDSYITVPWPIVKETLNKLTDNFGL